MVDDWNPEENPLCQLGGPTDHQGLLQEAQLVVLAL